jgi:oxygen-independent coproporphyrinogen III oxidase
MNSTLGLYISVPFCKAKCTFCNFASDTFAPTRMGRYIDRVCQEIANARSAANILEAHLPHEVDTLYLGGGTPSLLSPDHIRQLFAAIYGQFVVTQTAEITLECAPGQLSNETLEELKQHGLNRVSLGVQSFVDQESKAVGRLHTQQICLDEIARLRIAGIEDINLDLIAGLPHQTEFSWLHSIDTAIATSVPHISVYMLEVDEDSRLGREMLSSGGRYGSATVPTDDESAAFYQLACERLNAAGIHQYEISNFARPRIGGGSHSSRHNLKYWQRAPYLGLGLDAHSMLQTPTGPIRFSNTEDLDLYEGLINKNRSVILSESGAFAAAVEATASSYITATIPPQEIDRITPTQAFEESLFLGLRLNEGISLTELRDQFSSTMLDQIHPTLEELHTEGLLNRVEDNIALTDRGRMVSNEVFSRLLLAEPALA